ncbi:MAG: hypothetical protein AB7V19_02110 [Candidatus Bipolaricaulia bacterium]
MSRKRYRPEEIIAKLREAEILNDKQRRDTRRSVPTAVWGTNRLRLGPER